MSVKSKHLQIPTEISQILPKIAAKIPLPDICFTQKVKWTQHFGF